MMIHQSVVCKYRDDDKGYKERIIWISYPRGFTRHRKYMCIYQPWSMDEDEPFNTTRENDFKEYI